jgi:hypothetical protein
VHLFDIDIPGKIKFCESEVLDAGNHLTTFDTRMFMFILCVFFMNFFCYLVFSKKKAMHV